VVILWESFSCERKTKIKSCPGFSEFLTIATVLLEVKNKSQKYLRRSRFENCLNYFWKKQRLVSFFSPLSHSNSYQHCDLLLTVNSQCIAINNLFASVECSNPLFLTTYSNLCTQSRWCGAEILSIYWKYVQCDSKCLKISEARVMTCVVNNKRPQWLQWWHCPIAWEIRVSMLNLEIQSFSPKQHLFSCENERN
jgi:hypothetical protein